MNGRNDGNRPPASPRAEQFRDTIVNITDERITHFSIRALGYDPDSDDPKPAEALRWAVEAHEAHCRHRKMFIGALSTIGTAILAVVTWPAVSFLWQLLQRVAGR